MFCSQCGKQIPDGSTFCPSCGCKVYCENNQGISPDQKNMNFPGRPAGMGSMAGSSMDSPWRTDPSYMETASSKKHVRFKKWPVITLAVILTLVIAVSLFVFISRNGQFLILDSKFDTYYRTYYWYTYDEHGKINSEPAEIGTENKYGFVLSCEGSTDWASWKEKFTYSDFKGKIQPTRCVESYLNEEDGTSNSINYRYEYYGSVVKMIYDTDEEPQWIRFVERDRKGQIIRDRIYSDIDSISGHAYVTDRKWENTYEKGRVQTADISMDHYYLDDFDIEKAGIDAVLPSDCFTNITRAKIKYEY